MTIRANTPRPARAGRSAWLACLLAIVTQVTFASGLQVSPVTLSLHAGEPAQGLWLSNTGQAPLRAQVRVYRWTEAHGRDALAPTEDLVASPPMLEIAPGGQQLVRVIRLGDQAVASETAYRLAIDELPTAAPVSGLRFVLHYSLPVFVEPEGSVGAPDLRWRMWRSGQAVVLEAYNAGRGHARVTGVQFVAGDGRKVSLGQGLLGYVLPGASTRWTLPAAQGGWPGGGTLEASVNGSQTTQAVTLASQAP